MRRTIEHQLDKSGKPEMNGAPPPMRTGARSGDHRKKVLKLYVAGDLTLGQISESHQVPISTITSWAKHGGIPLRGRGRRPLLLPSAEDQQQLRSLETKTYAELASELGVTRARVGSKVKRWRWWITENGLRIGWDRRKPRTPSKVRKRDEPKAFVLSFRLDQSQMSELKHAWCNSSSMGGVSLPSFARWLLIQTVASKVAKTAGWAAQPEIQT
jgi:transposase